MTALAAAGTGFIAAGQAGAASAPAAVLWTSADGASWAAPKRVPSPAGGTVPEIVGLASADGTVTGVGAAIAGKSERPVVYTAPVP